MSQTRTATTGPHYIWVRGPAGTGAGWGYYSPDPRRVREAFTRIRSRLPAPGWLIDLRNLAPWQERQPEPPTGGR